MSRWRSTLTLLAVLIGVIGLDVAVRWPAAPEGAQLIAAPFDVADIDRVEVGRVDAPTVIERRDGAWWLASGPRADAAAVDRLLAVLDGGLVAEARVHDTDLSSYGLTGGQELRLSLLADGEPVVRLLVGRDAGAGATWVKAVDDPVVAQVRLGGRGALQGPWQDRTLWSVDPDAVEQVRVQGSAASWEAQREGGAWFGADGPGMEALLTTLASLRVVRWGAELPSGPPEVQLSLQPGGELRVWRSEGEAVGAVGDEGAVVRRDAVDWIDALPALQVHSLYRLPWQELQRLEVDGPAGRGVLVRDGAGWSVVQPVGISPPARRVAAVVRFASSPRLSARGEPVVDPVRTWTITSERGRQVVQLGAPAPQGVPVRTADGAASGWIDPRLVAAVDAVFGLVSPGVDPR